MKADKNMLNRINNQIQQNQLKMTSTMKNIVRVGILKSTTQANLGKVRTQDRHLAL